MVHGFREYVWAIGKDLLWGCLAVATSLAAQAQLPVLENETGVKAESTATLVIGGTLADEGDALHVRLALATHGARPSIIVITLTYDPTQLRFVEDAVTTESAALAAGKYAYGNVADVGKVRVIVWGLNINTLGDGDILTVTFNLLHPEEAGGLFVAGTDASIADPEGAAVPVDVVYFAPADVSASQDRADGILVAWQAVAGATGYRVYRNTTDSPGAAEPLSDWLGADALSYLDNSDLALGTPGMQCPGPEAGGRLYYWVRARDEAHQEGPLSAVSGQGFVSEAKLMAGLAVAVPKHSRSLIVDAPGDVMVLASAAALLMLAAWCGRACRRARRATTARRS